jgi:uroporphyrinogen decarboxylase
VTKVTAEHPNRALPETSALPATSALPETMALPETSALLRAISQRPGSRVPVWFMRQAGRSLPEYFGARGDGSILDAIKDPDRAVAITLQPVRRYGVDAAILFSDIVTPVWACGFGIDITPGVGPECEKPFASADDLARLRPLDPPVDLWFQTEAVKALTAELTVPLIGFAGAPFTLAAYLVEGRPSRDHAKVKSLMVSEPDLWHKLCDRLADLAITTLTAQAEAGASVVQLFDSWAGTLAPDHYRRYVASHSQRILAAMAEIGIPTIHFGVDTGELLDQFADAGASVVGVDWRTPLSVARARTGGRVALQGNLDPTLVLAPWETVAAEVRRVLEDNGGHPGHIFNLGHGVLPQTNPEILEQVVALVHAEGRADADPATL